MDRFAEITQLFLTGVEAVRPSVLMDGMLSMEGDVLSVSCKRCGTKSFDLSKFKNIYVIGSGKASATMAASIESILGDRISSGAVVTKYGFGKELNRIKLFEAGHPVPDDAGLKAAEAIVDICKQAAKDDLIINLLSGGASALMPYPADGISLEDKAKVSEILLAAGADISEINTIRKHLSLTKGGGLLKFTRPAKIISFIISDVVGDRMDIIGSGITHYEENSFSSCLEIISKYSLEEKFPVNVINYLNKAVGEKEQKMGSSVYVKSDVHNMLIGCNYKALEAVKAGAEQRGYAATIINSELEGEACELGIKIAKEAISLAANKQGSAGKYCLLWGGETIVTLKGKGKGGRNQELALAAAIALKGTEGITILSGGTDGNDGPTDAAGAICDGSTTERAAALLLDAESYLKDNDSYNFFKSEGGLLITGPTGTNVMDIQIALIT